MMSTRLAPEYRHKLDEIVNWLHVTRGLPQSRRIAFEYMIDLAYFGDEFAKDHHPDRSDSEPERIRARSEPQA